MNALWVIAFVIGLVAGDIGIGYHYKVPQTSYGVPTYQSSSNTDQTYKPSLVGSSSSNNYNNRYSNNLGTGTNYYTGQSTAQSQLSSTLGQNSGYQTGFQSAGNAGAGLNNNYYQTSSSAFSQPSYQSGSEYSAFNQYQTSSQYQSTAADKYQQYYNVIQQQPAQVFKHYYVHAAPEEPEESKPRQPIVLPPAQKHYKIIFIKAPSAPAPAPQIIPVQQQNEEKTIVYVLVKKPEEVQDIVLPTKTEQKPPSKPEVYFIKYNNKQDSQAVINNIVTDINKGGSSDSGYSGVSDTSGSFSGSNQAISSNGQAYEQALSLVENQGSSSTFDSSSLGLSSSFGSRLAGSTSGSGTSSVFGSGSTVSPSGAFGSGLIGSGNYGSGYGSSTGSYGLSSNTFGSSYDGAKGHNLNIATVDSGNAEGGYDGSSGSSGYHSSAVSSGYDNVSSTASTLMAFDASAISTSQGVPHETYGPPKFKVLKK